MAGMTSPSWNTHWDWEISESLLSNKGHHKKNCVRLSFLPFVTACIDPHCLCIHHHAGQVGCKSAEETSDVQLDSKAKVHCKAKRPNWTTTSRSCSTWLAVPKKQALGTGGKRKPHVFLHVLFRSRSFWIEIFSLFCERHISYIDIYCKIGESYQRWLSWFATQLGATLIFTQNVATLLHPINCHSTHGVWKIIIISVSGPFWGIFSRGNFLPFWGTVNWPSVMRLCCQFLGFLVQSGTMDLEQYENKSNKCLTNPLYSVDAISTAERYFSPCYWLLKSIESFTKQIRC